MSSKLKYDECVKNQEKKTNSTIFDYVTDSKKYINNSECFDDTPPFLAYTPRGISNQNIDIENDLRGINRPTTKCQDCKFLPQNLELVNGKVSEQNKTDVILGKKLCKPEQKIHPNGYFM